MGKGIYKIRNIITEDFYIGSAQSFKHRWSAHRSLLNRDKHPNPHLQHAWNKYGENVERIAQQNSKTFSGVGNPRAILDWEKVRFIRQEINAGRTTRKEMAQQYGVTQGTIDHIMTNLAWRESDA